MWRWQLHSWEHNRNHNCNCNCNLEQRYTFISNTFEYSDSQNVLRNIVTTLRSRKQKPWSSLFTLCQQGYHQVEQQSCGATEAYLWQLNSQYPTKCDKSRIVSKDTKLTMKQKNIGREIEGRKYSHQSYLILREGLLSFHQQPWEHILSSALADWWYKN